MIAKFVVLGAICAAGVFAQSAKVPDTPAGKALGAWLEAFNAGDKASLTAYFTKYKKGPGGSAEGATGFRSQTGGFQLLGADESDAGSVTFRVKEVSSPTIAVGKVVMAADDPSAVGRFTLRAVPPGVSVEAMMLRTDGPMRSRVIEGAIKQLQESYVFPEVAEKMAVALRERQKRGAYDIADADSLAEALTRDLQEISKDRHLHVFFSPMGPNGAPPAAPTAEMKARMKRENCAFAKAERLQGNIGYLKFNAFLDPTICAPTASASMAFLANVDALIIDLRENGGGDPKMVAYLSTYLFDKPTHLNDLYNRKEDSTTEYWTLKEVPGDRLAKVPVFLLTAKRTFSGAEEFSYNLKVLKRATIVGEVTGGGAHPTAGRRIDDNFQIGVPFARAVNPVTKTNWEGTGVEPDVKTPAPEALNVAIKLATERIDTGAGAVDGR